MCESPQVTENTEAQPRINNLAVHLADGLLHVVLQLVAVLLQRVLHPIAVNRVDAIGGRVLLSKRESPRPDALPNASGRVLQHQEVPVFACG
jgi:hypothetical protein